MGKFCLGDIQLVDTDSKLDIGSTTNIPVGLGLSWDGSTLKCNSGYVKSNKNTMLTTNGLSINLSGISQAIDNNILLGTSITWESLLELSSLDSTTGTTNSCALLNVGTGSYNGTKDTISNNVSTSLQAVLNGESYGYIDVVFKQPLQPGNYRVYHYVRKAYIYTTCTYQVGTATLSDDGTSYSLTNKQSWGGSEGDVDDVYYIIHPTINFNCLTFGYNNAAPAAPGSYGGGPSKFDLQKSIVQNIFNVYLCKDANSIYSIKLSQNGDALSDYEYAKIGQIDFSTITVTPTNDLCHNYLSGNILTNQDISVLLGGLRFIKINEVDYNNLATKDENTVYFIIS